MLTIVSAEPTTAFGALNAFGAEGTLRWKHSKWEIVPPGKFFPIAEETDLIIPAGEQALYLACALNEQWQFICSCPTQESRALQLP